MKVFVDYLKIDQQTPIEIRRKFSEIQIEKTQALFSCHDRRTAGASELTLC